MGFGLIVKPDGFPYLVLAASVPTPQFSFGKMAVATGSKAAHDI
jgi:hypothetical protein